MPHPPSRDAEDWPREMDAVSRLRDRESFMRIYDHFMPRVCLYLRGLGCTGAVAEELGQEALLKLWQRAELYDPTRSALSTWLFRIARNLHIDRVRREPNWVLAQDAVDGAADDADERDYSRAEDSAVQAELKRHIDALSAVQARLIRMSYFEAKTHQEISDELDLPLGTVKSHLRRAFLKLQGNLRTVP